jgi:hypothetical protein
MTSLLFIIALNEINYFNFKIIKPFKQIYNLYIF